MAALFLMRKEAPKFCNVTRSIGTKQEITMKEKWMSEKEALDKFGQTDLDKHCASGRVHWRECRTTWGAYEYLDTEDFERKTIGAAKRTWTQGQEYQQTEEEAGSWDNFLEKELHSLLMEQTPGKGTGKLTLGKGKGKQEGKGKGGRNPPGGPKEPKALEDMPEEEQMVEGLKKLKNTRDLLQSTMTNYDEALEKVKGMNYLAKSALKDKQQQLVCLETTLEKVKKQVAKGDKGRL